MLPEFLGTIILLGVYLAFLKRSLERNFRQMQQNPEIKSSRFSLFLSDLLASAGGIYLTLVMLCSFLSIEIPETMFWQQLKFNPLAAFSVLMALLQPLIINLYLKIFLNKKGY